MINDLELTTVVDVQGILTPVLTENDKKIIDKAISHIEKRLINFMILEFQDYSLKSRKLAIIEVARRLNACDEDMEKLTKLYQDEL